MTTIEPRRPGESSNRPPEPAPVPETPADTHPE